MSLLGHCIIKCILYSLYLIFVWCLSQVKMFGHLMLRSHGTVRNRHSQFPKSAHELLTVLPARFCTDTENAQSNITSYEKISFISLIQHRVGFSAQWQNWLCACAACPSVHACVYHTVRVQLFASFHRVPLWLLSWPSMPEVPHQSHVTLVPDTLVFTVSADGHIPLQKCLSLVKEEVFVLLSLLGNCPWLSLSGSRPHWKHSPVHNRCLFCVDFALLRLGRKNRILMQDVVHMQHFAVETVVGELNQQKKLSPDPLLKLILSCAKL